MIRVLLVDDQDFFRQGLATLLGAEPDLTIVGQGKDGQKAISLADELQPDIILMDVRMPICDGIVATREIHRRWPWIRILVLTTFEDDEYIWQSLHLGALGYLLKRTPSKQVAAAIRSLHQGYSQLGPTIAPKVFAQVKKPMDSPKIQLEKILSKRELDVLRLVGQGQSNQEIARRLCLSEGTVKNYVTRILNGLEQFGVRDRVQAALWAYRHLDLPS
ncbi:MAG: response regulator transcription factor [Cyanobacteria bacterium J06638_28]